MTFDNTFQDVDPDDNLFNNCYRSMEAENQSKYYSVSNFIESFGFTDRRFSICNYNIRSFNANYDDFCSLLVSLQYSFSVIALTETRFCSVNGVDIEGYSGWHCGRSSGVGGGVSVYCDSKLRDQQLANFSFVSDSIEVCTVKVNIFNRALIIVAVYRPPAASVTDFIDSLTNILNNTDVSSNEIILTGDINLNLIDSGDSNLEVANFVNSMFSLNFLPLITKPTRFPEGNQRGQPSLLDHMCYNRCSSVDSGILLYNVTDHLPTFLILSDFSVTNNDPIKLSFLDHSESNINLFINKCAGFSWNFPGDDVNRQTNYFIDSVDKLYTSCFPLKIKYVSRKRLSKPWLTNEIFELIKMKSAYFKKLKRGDISLQFYKRFKNDLTVSTRNAKRNYFVNTFNGFRRDIRSTLKLLNKLIVDGKSRRSIDCILDDDRELTEPLDIAETFNDYFSSVAAVLDSEIPGPTGDPIDNINSKVAQSIFFFPVGTEEISKIVNNLKNSNYGLDHIPSRIFKLGINFLTLPLSTIVNNSLVCGIFPDALKRASVIPIHKSGPETVKTNYRPISILPLVSKIFEKCVCIRMLSFLNKHNVFNR